jgi:hypothetical protein
MKSIAKLMELVYKVHQFGFQGEKWDPSLNSTTGEIVTKCNEAVNFVSKNMGYFLFDIPNTRNPDDAILANAMIDMMENRKEEWELLDIEAAQDQANQGRLIIAGWKNPTGDHGHVCVVIPGLIEFSGTLNSKVPKIINIGKSNFIGKKASFAFSELPKYYGLKEIT